MEIKLLDNYTVFLKGKKESVLIDPTEKELKNVKLTARIIVYTNGNLGSMNLNDSKILINGPGEYEIGGVEINGINGEDGITIYRIIIDGFIFVFLGKIKQELTPKRIEKLDSTDILFVPDKIGQESSYKLAKEWSKKWGVNYLMPLTENEESLKIFLDAADEEGLEKVDVLKLEKVDDLPDGLEIKLLKITE